MKEFDGKVVLVTGAAYGLGRATALRFAEEGAALVLLDVNAERLKDTAAAVEKLGARRKSIVTDVRTQANCAAAIQTAVDAFGRLDTLCNVAGINVFYRLAEITPADFERMLAVNLHGPFYLCQAAMPHLIKAKGSIVNVGSTASFMGEAYLIPYTVSKAGLLSLTKSLAMEFMHEPVRINAVAPGGMMTGMAEDIKIPQGMDPALIQRYSGFRPPAQPVDVAEVILFLASDKARNVHGACYAADGGVTTG